MGPLRMGSISRHLGRALPAATTIVDRLVDKQLVDRVSHPTDRRVDLCRITAQGNEVIERFWRIGRERIDMVANLLDEEQLEFVVQGLELIGKTEMQVQESLRTMLPDQ